MALGRDGQVAAVIIDEASLSVSGSVKHPCGVQSAEQVHD